MNALRSILAAHPIRKKPYNAIRLDHIDGNGVPIYRVARCERHMGASAALKLAFETFGGHCFHCEIWMSPQPLSHRCTRDHLRPKADGGSDYLHNLVLACGPCNRAKGRSGITDFHAERSAEYLKALDEHIVRCIVNLQAV